MNLKDKFRLEIHMFVYLFVCFFVSSNCQNGISDEYFDFDRFVFTI